MEELIDQYLQSLGSTLWGRAFNIQDPSQRRQAAKWMATQMENVQDHAWRAEPIADRLPYA